MRKTLYFFSLCMLLLPFASARNAVEPTNISITVKGLENAEVYIAYYYGDKQYINDTIQADATGRAVWKKTVPSDQGIYLFVTPEKRYFEFLVTDDQQFSMETELDDLVGKMKVSGSKENEAFYQYLHDLEPLGKAAAEIRGKMEGADEAETEKLQQELNGYDEKAKDVKERFIRKNPEFFFTKVLLASEEVRPPETQPEDNPLPDSLFDFYYVRQHYFDNLDFSDGRMLRTPVFAQKVKAYFNRMTVQHPDSAVVSASKVMKLADQNEELFKYCCIWITNKYANDKRMCMDAVYVYMGETYYLSGRATWVDSTQLEKIKDRVLKMKYNRCGYRSVNWNLQNLEGGTTELYKVNAKYTILYFWDYDCGHCKKVTPLMKEFEEEYRSKGVQVIGFCTRDDKLKWKEKIDEYEIGEWIQVIDPENKSFFRVYYDIYSTPVIYLLDENKKIIAKRMDVEGLRKLIDFEMNKEE